MGSISPAMNGNEEVDLVVIGGGPTGLLSAVLARHMGLSVAIIDEKSGPLKLGRADALNARTQQYLEVVGILDELRSKGIECNTSSTFAEGEFKSRQSKWWTSLEHCLHRNFLMIGQPDVEAALLKKLDTPVSYGEQAISISEDEESAVITTNRGRTLRGKYAIGADGARSMVRAALDITFTGTKPEMVWSVLDTFIDTDFPVCSEIVTFQLNGQSRVSWIPRERGMARFYVLLDGEITQDKAENSIREHLAPHRVTFLKTEWFSTFEVKERIASTFVSKRGTGRVVLAGDAAHVHSVNGGQGLNTGIADAFGLGWRIALAVRHAKLSPQGASQLVQSYDTERRAVAGDVIGVAAKLVRDTIRTAKEYVGTIEKNAGYITGMGVAYDGTGSALISESEVGIWKAGKRCPDFSLLGSESGEPQRLYSIVPYGQFLILSIGSRQDHCQPREELPTTHLTILPSVAGGVQSATGGTSSTYEADIVTSAEPFKVVVRPDMYIGYVGNEAGVNEYMDSILSLS
ncbi:hypothetical protein JX265_012886 [Neoarthrinium moseri]|uniref:FAD-binding domain-containing protein n=1 Tax=Neoarthrinium moseri TaxID=1658444 RepID=A0A9P9W9M2_9PEZI|nr:hypothetical protein JX265_012886 [Neoarthrinium moseri]